jgi:3-hydroxyisobutyrate dehydrogenase-like beta-hydroxyacid dehydrogenase
MKPDVAIVAAGSMGAGVARRLAEHGVRVLTLLAGRSAASQQRAAEAGMVAVSADALVDVDFVLSIVPPGNALAFAEQTAFALKSAQRKPVFVDCNAVSPATVRHIHAVITATGTDFIDAGIIGMPPVAGRKDGPQIYASGEHASKLQALAAYGLDIRVLEGPVGAASALKMAYAGISKGHIAVFAAMVLAAQRSGCADALRAQLAETDSALLASMATRIPRAFPKAYRWVAEMQEIAEFAREDPAARDIWTGISQLYERLARDLTGSRSETDGLARFFEEAGSRSTPQGTPPRKRRRR